MNDANLFTEHYGDGFISGFIEGGGEWNFLNFDREAGQLKIDGEFELVRIYTNGLMNALFVQSSMQL